MKEKKPCQLCDNLATMYCEPDQANLCWDCDSRVHGGNFLAAKHQRNLLCRSCQSPTLWSALGPRLAPMASVCEKCVGCGAWDDRSDSTRSSHGEGE
ncbi:B-box domain protein 31-like [Rhodamnia argentea]|uniref:B-box domain protein 31-like n=1 Tax=Rhodamnia argentea TaxID=178133 RepID=A0A8B8MRF5_9MYRT|nr:B-box domain protein 31-like [Rhodamnia argentea]